jgi:hypothetical protein
MVIAMLGEALKACQYFFWNFIPNTDYRERSSLT